MKKKCLFNLPTDSEKAWFMNALQHFIIYEDPFQRERLLVVKKDAALRPTLQWGTRVKRMRKASIT